MLGDRSDLLRGGSGTVIGEIPAGDGNDRIFSGLGDDTVRVGFGNDLPRGGAGEDLLFGNAGADQMTASTLNDAFQVYHSGGADRITDFSAGVHPDLSSFSFTVLAQVSAMAADTGAGQFIDDDSRDGGTILLDGLLKAAFVAAGVIL